MGEDWPFILLYDYLIFINKGIEVEERDEDVRDLGRNYFMGNIIDYFVLILISGTTFYTVAFVFDCWQLKKIRASIKIILI